MKYTAASQSEKRDCTSEGNMDVTEKCIQIGDIQTRAYAHMPKTRLN